MKWYLMALKNYAGFKGRARRKEFWMFNLISTIISYSLLALVFVNPSLVYANSIYSLAVLVPALAVGVRRMHDVGKSGWFLLIPFYNIYLLCINGEAGENKYGSDPKNGVSFNNEALDSHLTN